MKKYFKKILFIVLFISVLIIQFPVSASIGDVTDIGIAKYYVESVKEENNLHFGVKQYTHIGHTSAITGEVTDMGMGVTEAFVADKYYPQQVSMLEIPSSTDVSLVPWAYIKDSAWSLKTVRDLSRDFEATNPGYKVLAAVNGDFFDISGGNMYPFTPNNLHSTFGDNLKSVHNNRAVGFLNDGSSNPLVGNKPIVRNEKPTLAIYDEEDNIIKEFSVNNVNEQPGENEISVLYPRYYVPEHNAASKSETINVENAFIVNDGEYSIPFTKVAKVYGYVSDNLDFFGKGRITSFGSASLSANDFAIKSNNPEITAALQVGAKIRVQYEFSGAFENVDNIIGVNQRVLIDGQKKDNITQRAPRTMVGVKADGTILLSVIDGRQPSKQMYGAAMAEMAAVMKHYGAVEAYNLDGGGSSTMVIAEDDDFRVVNTYSDSVERTDANALLVVMKKPILNVEGRDISTTSITLDVNVLNANGYNQDNLYVKMNNETKQIINGEVTFNNLEKEKEYSYEVLYKKDDEYIGLFIKDKIKTSKSGPILNSLKIKYNGNDLIFEVDVLDTDKTIINGNIKIGDVIMPIVDGIASFSKFRGKPFLDLEISYKVNIDDGQGEVIVIATNYKVYTTTDILIDQGMNEFNNILDDLYK